MECGPTTSKGSCAGGTGREGWQRDQRRYLTVEARASQEILFVVQRQGRDQKSAMSRLDPYLRKSLQLTKPPRPAGAWERLPVDDHHPLPAVAGAGVHFGDEALRLRIRPLLFIILGARGSVSAKAIDVKATRPKSA